MSTVNGSSTCNEHPCAGASALHGGSSSDVLEAANDGWRAALHELELAWEEIEAEILRLRGLARLALRVRDAQRAYFKSRSRDDLIASKQAEKDLDAALAAAHRQKGEPTNAGSC